jgi:hypothetical protein
LAISPQIKQDILPALFGITRLTEVQSRGWDDPVIRLTACILNAFINILACPCICRRLSRYYRRSTPTMVYLWRHTLRTPQSLIRHASARLPPTLEAATPSGILPSPIKAFHCHPWFLKPRQDIFISTLTRLLILINTGCLG